MDAKPSGADNRSLAVSTLKGVGPALTANLAKLGIEQVGDLLMHLPVRYMRISPVGTTDDFNEGDVARLELKVVSAFAKRGGKVPTVFAEALDEHGVSVRLIWFGRPYLARQLPGETIVVSGTLEGKSKLSLAVKEWEYAAKLPSESRGEGLRPLYRLTDGISQDKLYSLIDAAFAACPRIPEPLPPALRERHELPPLRGALRMIHHPETEAEPAIGRRRLVFDELLPSQLSLLLLRRRDTKLPAAKLTDDSLAARLIDGLPFALSKGQERAWWRLGGLLTEERPSRVLVQGDVGAGKTVIAGLAAARAAASGRVAALLAPTETLALQHAESIRLMMEPAGIKMAVLLGTTPAEEKDEILGKLEWGEINVVVGTHALFSPAALHRYAKNLGVVVIDEQHRFGVGQRHALVDAAAKEGVGVHYIQLSATPIPRTLAMTSFGDLDVIDLPSRESAKRRVKTGVGPALKDGVWVNLVRRSVADGDGVYVVCPRIEDDGSGRAVLAPKLAEQLADMRVGLAHGKQKGSELQDAIQAFAGGETDVLVATTVIEVGIDVARASGIVVLDADRFGLATLHQLRGRVGRKGQEAWCLIVPSKEATPEAKARLEALARIHDGKELAEIDLRLRGGGNVLGDGQSGRSGFVVASLDRDEDKRVLAEARHAAKSILRADPRLSEPDNAAIKKIILARVAALLKVGQG